LSVFLHHKGILYIHVEKKRVIANPYRVIVRSYVFLLRIASVHVQARRCIKCSSCNIKCVWLLDV